MRWILLTLVVINAAYFMVWQGGSQSTPIVQPMRQGVPLKLLGEAIKPETKPSTQIALTPSPSLKQATPAVKSLPASAGEQAICHIIGPFNSVVAQSWAQDILRKRGVEAEPVLVTEHESAEYQVVLHQVVDKEMPRVIETLRAKGVDAYRKKNSLKRHEIFLGGFNELSKARAYVQHIKTMGFAADVEQNLLAEDSLWLQLGEPLNEKEQDGIWLGLVKNFTMLEQKKSACNVQELVVS